MIKKPITINLSTGLEARECKEHYGYDDAWA